MYVIIILLLLGYGMQNNLALAEENINKTHRLYVDVFPPDARARIFVWNIKPKFQQGIALPPGNYDLRVKAVGYHDWQKNVILIDGDHLEAVELTPITEPKPIVELPTYSLNIAIEPSDAQVHLVRNETRLDFEQNMLLEADRYKVFISKDGYLPQEGIIDLFSDTKQTFILQPELPELPEEPPEPPEQIATPVETPPQPGRFNLGFMRNFATSKKDDFSLELELEPNDITVKIIADNLNLFYSPGLRLKPGEYTIIAEHSNHITRREKLHITDHDLKHKILLSAAPKCFFGEAQEQNKNYFYNVRLNFYQDFIAMQYRIYAMPTKQVTTYEFYGIQRGQELELIGRLGNEELKTYAKLTQDELLESINGVSQTLKSVPCISTERSN